MALKFLRIRFCILLLIIYVIRDLGLGRVAGSLLDGCRQRTVDLLLIADGYLPSEEQTEQMNFLTEILDLFSTPGESDLTNLRVALASMTSVGPVEHFSFPDHHKIQEAKQAIMNASVVNITAETQTFSSSLPPNLVNSSPFHAFSESQGGRRDSDRVVVLVISTDALKAEQERVTRDAAGLPTDDNGYDALNIQVCKNEYNATILLAVIGDIDTIDYPYPATLTCVMRLSEAAEQEFDTLGISVAKELCNEYGMFHDEGFNLGSWYYVPQSLVPFITWYEAEELCTTTGGELASVETQEELDFLSSSLKLLFTRANLWHTEFGNGVPVDLVHVAIGLIRDTENVAARFQWRNGLPLLLSHWQPDFPDAGTDCGKWEFRWNDSEDDVDWFVNGGCVTYWNQVALCEVILKQYQTERKNLITIPPAKTYTFTDALNRGEFAVLDDAIVSMAASVQDFHFARSILNPNAAFPVFNCEPDIEPGSFIPYSYVCDNKPNCENLRDERICLYRECDVTTEFTCHSGQCIPEESRCDLVKDCLDGSDEQSCRECKHSTCTDGTCLPSVYVNDGEKDCGCCDWDSNPDFYLCDFHCINMGGLRCLRQYGLGDGYNDCQGPEGPVDEILGKLQKSTFCSTHRISRWSPLCVYVKDQFGGVLGCRDMSHLRNCQNFTCPEGYVKCPESYCIPMYYVLDGKMDCPLGEDEKKVEPTGCKGNFACWGSEICLHPDQVCDGGPQCPLGDDELDCRVACEDGFRCIGGTVTVTDDFDRSKPLSSLSFISPLTRYLDLSGVDLSSNYTYENRGQFYHLTELRLSASKLRDAFGEFAADLHRLRTVYLVDLSYNLITEITQHSMFSHMANLRHLDLSHNKLLTILPPNGFQQFLEASSLQYLDLSDTAITHLNQAFLQELTNLNTLNLTLTNIERITKNNFPENFALTTLDLRQMPIVEIHPDSLKELTIYSHLYTDSYKLCCPQIRGPYIPEHTCHAPQEAVSSCFDLVGDKTQRVLLWLVGTLALLGNVVVIVYRVVFDKDVLKKAYGLFVTNLSLADLLMGIYLIIIAGTDIRYRDNYVLHETNWRHSTLCQISGFLSTLSSETSAFFIFLVTVDRFLVLKFPYGQYRFSKVGKIVSCAVAWCGGFLLALIPTLPAFSDWTLYSSNGMCLGLPLTTERLRGWRYSVAVFIVLNFILFLLIACGQYLIYRAVSENRMTGEAVAKHSARRAQDILIAKQLSLVALSDFFCWFPIGFMGLLALSGHEISKDAYTWSAVLVLPVNSALNPVLYTVPVLMAKWEKFKTGHFTSTTSTTTVTGKK